MQIIPSRFDACDWLSPNDFTRNRKLTFGKLITFILSITATGKNKGVDVKSGEFFRQAGRSGLWLNPEPVHRSALTKARRKVPWQVFRDILKKAVQLAYEFWPEAPQFLWHRMSVFAIDGSRYVLPATDEIRKEFDPRSGLQNPGKGHFPQCLVSTAYDVFRRLPTARTVVPVDSSERQEAKDLIPFIPENGVVMFDRGYPSFELIDYLMVHYAGFFIFRCASESAFSAALGFLRSRKQESVIWITPTSGYLRKIPRRDRKMVKHIKLRVIRLTAPNGTGSLLLTNLYDTRQFPRKEIIHLYQRRWEVETYYRDEKYSLDLKSFHARTSNGIRQELFGAMIMSVISRTLMQQSSLAFFETSREPQFKNAVATLASEAAVLCADDPETAIKIFDSILEEIYRVRYYRPKKPRAAMPRVTKRSYNKWTIAKAKGALRA